jgi:hypothetical protein
MTQAGPYIVTSAPTVGRIVHYTLSGEDAAAINRRRDDFEAFCGSHAHPHEPGQPGATGHIGHVGSQAREGDVCAATVVRVSDLPTATANLQVHLDGNDTYWAKARTEGAGPGFWRWPPRPDSPPSQQIHDQMRTISETA